MSDYLVHSSRERARIRHAIFEDMANISAAMDLLKSEPGLAGIKPGNGSILLLLEPDASVPNICSKLETAFPALKDNKKAPAPASCASVKNAHRKCLLKSMLTAGLCTVGFITIGMKHAHAAAGVIFALFATHHVWERRQRI